MQERESTVAVNSKDIKEMVSKLKMQQRGPKKNITFRLSERIIRDFQKKCDRSDLGYGTVIEELMLLFVGSA